MTTYRPKVGDLIIRAEDRHHWVKRSPGEAMTTDQSREDAIAAAQAMLARYLTADEPDESLVEQAHAALLAALTPEEPVSPEEDPE